MDRDVIYTETYRGYRIDISPDLNPTSPREWDNAGKIVCWHPRYNLGDEQPKTSPGEWLLDLLQHELEYDSLAYQRAENMNISELLEALDEFYIFLPIWMCEHSGITISTSHTGQYNDRWDSGQIGWIYISKKDAVKEWGNKLFTSAVEAKAVAYLQSDIKVYDDYLVGNIFGYEIYGPEDDEDSIDSVWGYYPEAKDRTGYYYCLKEARSAVDWMLKEVEEKQWQSVMAIEDIAAACE